MNWLLRRLRVLWLRNECRHLIDAIAEETERHDQYEARLLAWSRELMWRRGEIDRLLGRAAPFNTTICAPMSRGRIIKGV